MDSVFFRDLAERVVRTFVQAFIATVAAGATGVVDVGSLRALAVASFAAALAAVMALATKNVGHDNDTASVV